MKHHTWSGLMGNNNRSWHSRYSIKTKFILFAVRNILGHLTQNMESCPWVLVVKIALTVWKKNSLGEANHCYRNQTDSECAISLHGFSSESETCSLLVFHQLTEMETLVLSATISEIWLVGEKYVGENVRIVAYILIQFQNELIYNNLYLLAAKPVITSPQHNTTLFISAVDRETGNVEINCSTAETELPTTITWFHNGNKLNTSDTTVMVSALAMNGSLEPYGVYQCFVSNAAGESVLVTRVLPPG